MSDLLLAVSTCPNAEVADRIGGALVKEKLAACVNILPGAIAIYEWRGKIERDQELVLLIKTRGTRFKAMSARLVELHPYELPEVIAVPVTAGNPEYLKWVEQCTSYAE